MFNLCNFLKSLPYLSCVLTLWGLTVATTCIFQVQDKREVVVRLTKPDLYITDAMIADDNMWLITHDKLTGTFSGLYRVSESDVQLVAVDEGIVINWMSNIGGKPWFATNIGVFTEEERGQNI